MARLRIKLLVLAALAAGCKDTNKVGTPKTTATKTATSTTTTTTTTSTSTATATATGKSAVLTWTANREKGVNSTGGGYRVYYSTVNGFSTTTAGYVSVANPGSGATPATTTVTGLTAATTYYFRVGAYSTVNTAGSVSSQLTVAVP